MRYSTFECKEVPCEYAYLDKDMQLVIRLPRHQLTNDETVKFNEWLASSLKADDA